MRVVILTCILIVIAGLSTANAAVCDIDIYGLSVSDGDEITANIKNLGNTQEEVFYRFYINGRPIEGDPVVTLHPGEVKTVGTLYPFSHGTYDIGISAVSTCGDTDTQSMQHTVLEDYVCRNPLGREGEDYCDSSVQSYFICRNGRWELLSRNSDYYCYNCDTCGDGVLNCGETEKTCPQDVRPPVTCEERPLQKFRCSVSVRQQQFQYRDCSTSWVSIEYCPYGCEAGICIPFTEEHREEQEEVEEEQECGIEIQNLYYARSVLVDSSNIVSLELLNNIDNMEDVEVIFYVDGIRHRHIFISAAPHATLKQSFEYSLNEPGWHALSFDVIAKADGCRTSDFANIRVYALPKTEETHISVAPEETVPSGLTTDVDIYPEEIDSYVFDGSVITIDIESAKPQRFSISVVGVPYDWVSHNHEVFVDENKTAYIYLTPKRSGKHEMLVMVSALKEGKIFIKKINIFALDKTVSNQYFTESTNRIYVDTGDGMKNIKTETISIITPSLYAVYETISYALIILIFILPVFYYLTGTKMKKKIEPEFEF